MTTATSSSSAAAARRAAEAAARRAAEAREAARAAAERAQRAQEQSVGQQQAGQLEARAGRLLETAEQKTEKAIAALDSAETRTTPFAPPMSFRDHFEVSPAERKLERLSVRERAADVELDGLRAQRSGLTPAAKKDLRLDAEARLRSSPAYSNLDDEASRVAFIEALEDEAARLPAEEATRLVTSLRPQLTEVAKSANGSPSEDVRRDVIDGFSDLAERTGPNGARVLAESFAEVAVDDHTDVDDTDQLGGALKASITGGHGAAFAAALTQELRASHAGTDLAEDVTKATREGLRDVREAFDAGTAKFANLDPHLKATVEVLGPDATKEEQQAAVQKFLEENAEAYEDFEDASAKLVKVLDGAAMLASDASMPEDLRSESTEALTRLELAGNSKAGRAKLAEAVAESQHRETMGDSFLDDVTAASEGGRITKAATGLIDKLAQVRVVAAGQVTKTLGNDAVLASLSGNSARAVQGVQKLLDGDVSAGGPQLLTGVGGLTAGAATLAPFFTAAAASSAVPVAGQIAGAALVLAGVVWTGIDAANAEAESEQSWQSLFEDLGVDAETAERLAQADDDDGRSVMPFLVELRDGLGADEREFAEWVQTMNPNAAGLVAHLSRDVPPGELSDEQLDALRTIGLVPGGTLELNSGFAYRGDAEVAADLAGQQDDSVAIGAFVFNRSAYEYYRQAADPLG
ncbi:MAG: hypothetical protein JNK82_25880 [Myxococcaceae bacterium]|nr:hypothetical protein [Myxococcaceae bacterium]